MDRKPAWKSLTLIGAVLALVWSVVAQVNTGVADPAAVGAAGAPLVVPGVDAAAVAEDVVQAVDASKEAADGEDWFGLVATLLAFALTVYGRWRKGDLRALPEPRNPSGPKSVLLVSLFMLPLLAGCPSTVTLATGGIAIERDGEAVCARAWSPADPAVMTTCITKLSEPVRLPASLFRKLCDRDARCAWTEPTP